MHGSSRMTIDPRIPTMPGRSTSGIHRPGRHCLHQARSAFRCWASRVKGELHPTGEGRAYSFVACLRRLTNDQASLPRRSTVPTPERDTRNIWALITFFFFHILHLEQKKKVILSPSCLAFCGDHLSPRRAIVFSLLSKEY